MKTSKTATFERVAGKEIKLTIERDEKDVREHHFKHTLPAFKVGNFKISFIEYYHDCKDNLISKIVIKAKNPNFLEVEIYRDGSLLSRLYLKINNDNLDVEVLNIYNETIRVKTAKDFEIAYYPTILVIEKV